MEKFAGLCVGGPYAGKQIVEMTGKFAVHERPQRRLGRIDGKVSRFPNAVKTHHYHSHMVGEVGLWVHESMTLDEAVKEIAAGYIAACKQADPRVIPSFTR